MLFDGLVNRIKIYPPLPKVDCPCFPFKWAK